MQEDNLLLRVEAKRTEALYYALRQTFPRTASGLQYCKLFG